MLKVLDKESKQFCRAETALKEILGEGRATTSCSRATGSLKPQLRERNGAC